MLMSGWLSCVDVWKKSWGQTSLKLHVPMGIRGSHTIHVWHMYCTYVHVKLIFMVNASNATIGPLDVRIPSRRCAVWCPSNWSLMLWSLQGTKKHVSTQWNSWKHRSSTSADQRWPFFWRKKNSNWGYHVSNVPVYIYIFRYLYV